MPEPIHRRVLSIIHDPVIRFEGGRKLHAVLRWTQRIGS